MRKILLLLSVAALLGSCKKALEEEVFSDLGSNNFYKTPEDAEALLAGAYAASHGDESRTANYLLTGEVTTDILIQRGGSINVLFKPAEDFTWDANHQRLTDLWNQHYSAIYRSNVVLDKVPAISMPEERKKVLLAEARFLRAFSYLYLYNWFGTVPLIVTSNVSITDRPARGTEAEMAAFFEAEFNRAAQDLPTRQSQFGRATSGAAIGFLARYYLNQKKWTEAAATTKRVMDAGYHDLFLTPNRIDLFALQNEGNKEMIYVLPLIPVTNLGSNYLSLAAPPNYKFRWPGKVKFAANISIRSAFLTLFNTADDRRKAFLFSYTNTNNQTVNLGTDNVRSFKYPEDSLGINQFSGNDFPLLRYADILLIRAEALNELQGPNAESITLINRIRDAAHVAPITLATYASKDALRAFILDERGREFHTEALRREDLIRHGKYISMAAARGKAAQSHHVLFPIPQSEVDKNANLKQNPGY